MPTFLSRLRGGRPSSAQTHDAPLQSPPFASPSSSASAQTSATSPTSPRTPPFHLDSIPKRNLVGRQIRPDLDSLLDRYAAEADIPQGLKPRRHSVGSHASSGVTRSAPPSAGLTPPNEEHEQAMPEPREDKVPPRRPKLERHALSQLSIFGIRSSLSRSREGTPSPEEARSRAVERGPSRTQSTQGDKGDENARRNRRSLGSLDFSPLTPVRSSSLETRRRTKTDPGGFKFNTISFTPRTTPSRRTTGTSRASRSNSNTPHSSSTPSSKSRRSLHLRLGNTPISHLTRAQLADSPGTFGHPTPPDDPESEFPFTFTPPPMPPLDHPELVAALASRSNLSDSQPSRSLRTSTRSATTPSEASTLSSRPPRANGSLSSFPSAYFRSTRSIRPYASLPKVQQIFGQSQGQSGIEAPRYSRGRSMSEGPRQRTRSVAVAVELDDDRPGEDVIVEKDEDSPQLDRTDPVAGIPGGVPADIRTRGKHVPGTIPASLSVTPRPLSFPSDIPSSSALGSPFLLQGSDVDRDLSEGGNGRLAQAADDDTTAKDSGMQEDVNAPVSSGMVAPISLDSPTEEGSNASASPPKKPNLPSSKSAPGSSSLLSPPTVSIIAPTPVASPTESPRRTVSDSAASHGLGTPPSSKSIGKRKAEDVEVMSAVPKHVHHPSFVLPMPERSASRHSSEASRAPSAFHTPKRARLSSPSHSPSGSRQGSINRVPKGSWSSQTSSKVHGMAPSRAPSTRSNSTPAHITNDVDHRRSLSQASIPVHAIVMPHVPSISRSSTYHMRDPRRPPKIQPTPWSLRLPSEEEDGSPIHAWIFFIGFLLFPIWWVASFLPIPRTRQMGGTDTEKAVTLDDPQIEHDARIWRRRCRIMAFVSLFTYIPFIVLVAVFVSRRP